MIVIIEDEVFSSPRTDPLALLSLFQLGYEGQHRIQTDPLYSSEADQALNRWLAKQDPTTREAVVLALESGLESDASDIPLDLTVRVTTVDQPSNWESVPLRLPLAVALPFLRRPLRVLVENRHNDGAFLRVVAPPPWREEYLKLQKAGWIELDHGGGSDMQTRARTVRHDEALRLWALFDSDAREPGKPSQQSEALRMACLKARITHHQLRRRFIESYLPSQSLVAWAHKSSGAVGRARRETAEAFASMQPDQRHHYNLKGGFNKDRETGIPSFYGPHAEDRRLQAGFGGSIGALFHEEDFRIREDWLIRDGQREETTEMLQSLFRRL